MRVLPPDHQSLHRPSYLPSIFIWSDPMPVCEMNCIPLDICQPLWRSSHCVRSNSLEGRYTPCHTLDSPYFCLAACRTLCHRASRQTGRIYSGEWYPGLVGVDKSSEDFSYFIHLCVWLSLYNCRDGQMHPGITASSRSISLDLYIDDLAFIKASIS